MATEPPDGTDVSVSLPPPLEEWVDERAAALGVDRAELLVQVVGAYRATADLGDDGPLGGDGDLDERIESTVRTELQDHEADVSAVEDRIDAIEDDIEDDLESLRNRVLQLRDAVRNRAKTDHTHEEFARYADRLDAVATDVADLGDEVSDLDDEVADARSKLNTLARLVLEIRRDGRETTAERRRQLEQLRTTANRLGVTEASCHGCEGTVSIPLLTEPSCPHCEAALRDLTTTGIIFTRAVLTGPEPAAADGPDSEEATPGDGGTDE
jgi:methyl-accepting chemotaxis protein